MEKERVGRNDANKYFLSRAKATAIGRRPSCESCNKKTSMKTGKRERLYFVKGTNEVEMGLGGEFM